MMEYWSRDSQCRALWEPRLSWTEGATAIEASARVVARSAIPVGISCCRNTDAWSDLGRVLDRLKYCRTDLKQRIDWLVREVHLRKQ